MLFLLLVAGKKDLWLQYTEKNGSFSVQKYRNIHDLYILHAHFSMQIAKALYNIIIGITAVI